MINFKEEARKSFDQMIADRRYLHQIPEIGSDTPKTKAYVAEQLKKIGIEPADCGQNGITALIGDPSKGKVILLRADMDALPMEEFNTLPFRSKEKRAHVCGHDIHTTMLLHAAKILKEREDDLNGAVKLMFQPGEETSTGAQDMVDSGILENPKVDAAMAIHVFPFAKVGQLRYYIKKPAMTSSMDVFFFKFHGKGGHSSAPEKCIDPIHMIASLYMQLSSLVSKECSPRETAVLTVGKMGGGTAVNIIPDTAELACGLRCYNNAVRERLCARIEEIAQSIALLNKGTCELELRASTPSVETSIELCKELLPSLEEIFGDGLIESDVPMAASEDFSAVSSHVPTCYFQIGANLEGNDYPLHNPNVVLDENVMPYGVATLAACAYGFLNK